MDKPEFQGNLLQKERDGEGKSTDLGTGHRVGAMQAAP